MKCEHCAERLVAPDAPLCPVSGCEMCEDCARDAEGTCPYGLGEPEE